eukprot:c11788_g1_i1.p1 GENE.c11788_g1_i1~~c11788_g1_i1.p1  ORF type:complete len:281 (-),score=78.14 c11788_g1_i1:224-1012(-)
MRGLAVALAVIVVIVGQGSTHTNAMAPPLVPDRAAVLDVLHEAGKWAADKGDSHVMSLIHNASTVLNSPELNNLTLKLVNDPDLALSVLRECPHASRAMLDVLSSLALAITTTNASNITNNNTNGNNTLRSALTNAPPHTFWNKVCQRHGREPCTFVPDLPEQGASHLTGNTNALVQLGEGVSDSTDSGLMTCGVMGPLGAFIGALGALVAYTTRGEVAGGASSEFASFASMLMMSTLNGPFFLSTLACNPQLLFNSTTAAI